MDILVQNKIRNDILNREEIEVLVNHEGGTPKSEEIKKELSQTLMMKKELIIMNQITPRFGAKQLKVKIHVYDSEDAMKIEAKKEKKTEEKKA